MPSHSNIGEIPTSLRRAKSGSSSVSDQPTLTHTTADLHTFLRTRRSIRRFKPDPVPDPILQSVLATATCFFSPAGAHLPSRVPTPDVSSRSGSRRLGPPAPGQRLQQRQRQRAPGLLRQHPVAELLPGWEVPALQEQPAGRGRVLLPVRRPRPHSLEENESAGKERTGRAPPGCDGRRGLNS